MAVRQRNRAKGFILVAFRTPELRKPSGTRLLYEPCFPRKKRGKINEL
jgi:hypothetical protein